MFSQASVPPAISVLRAPQRGFRPPFRPVVEVTIYEGLGLALGSATYVDYVLCIHGSYLSPLISHKYRLSFLSLCIDARPRFLLTCISKISKFSCKASLPMLFILNLSRLIHGLAFLKTSTKFDRNEHVICSLCAYGTRVNNNWRQRQCRRYHDC